MLKIFFPFQKLKIILAILFLHIAAYVRELKPKAFLSSNKPPISGRLELDSGLFSNGCVSLKNNATCPVDHGQNVTYVSKYLVNSQAEILAENPRPVDFMFRLVNEQDRLVVCIELPIIIEKPKSKLRKFFSDLGDKISDIFG